MWLHIELPEIDWIWSSVFFFCFFLAFSPDFPPQGNQLIDLVSLPSLQRLLAKYTEKNKRKEVGSQNLWQSGKKERERERGERKVKCQTGGYSILVYIFSFFCFFLFVVMPLNFCQFVNPDLIFSIFIYFILIFIKLWYYLAEDSDLPISIWVLVGNKQK